MTTTLISERWSGVEKASYVSSAIFFCPPPPAHFERTTHFPSAVLGLYLSIIIIIILFFLSLFIIRNATATFREALYG
jgi:hypothetical protein